MRNAFVLGLAGCALAGMAAAAEPWSGGSGERSEAYLERIEQLSEPDLKQFYLHCARESVRQRLGGGEIALCSIGYERLLKETFNGDFRAFLEWRRSARRSAEQEPGTEVR